MTEEIVKVEATKGWTRGNSGRIYEAHIISKNPNERPRIRKILKSMGFLIFLFVAFELVKALYHVVDNAAVEHGWMFTLTVIVFSILLPICATFFLVWAYRQKYPKEKGGPLEDLVWHQKLHGWLLKNRIFTFLLFPLFNLDGWLLSDIFASSSHAPNFWSTHMFDPRMLGLEAILLIFGWMASRGNVPLEEKFGKIGLQVTGAIIALSIAHYLWIDYKTENGSSQSASVLMAAPANVTTVQTNPFPQLRPFLNDEVAIRKILEAKLGDTTEGLNAQWDLIRIGKRESELKQWGPDGKVSHGDDNPHDKCAFMINTDKQADVVAKHDITTMEGCIDAAIEIYQKDKQAGGDGTRPWFLSDHNKAVHVGEKVFVAPVGEWSEEIPTGYGAMEVPDGWIKLITDKGEEFELGKPGVTGNVYTPHSLWVKVQSKTGMPVNVTIIP